MNRRQFTRALAAAILIFASATRQLAAYEPYSQFKEFTFVGGTGTTVNASVPTGMIWAIEAVSGQIRVAHNLHITNLFIFNQPVPGGTADNIIFPNPVLTSPNAVIGPNTMDIYTFNDGARAYYSSNQVAINAAHDGFDAQAASISISLTGYLIPLSTVWTGPTSLSAGDIKEVTIDELQLADNLQSGSDTMMGSFHFITPGGELRVGAGKQLRFTGTTPLVAPNGYNSVNYNGGSIQVLGNTNSTSELEFTGSLANAPSTGLIAAHDAALRFTGGLDNYGAVSLTRGGNDVFGDITNHPGATIVVAGGANVTFYDDIMQNGTLQIAKFGSTTSVAVFLGSFTGSGGYSGGGDAYFAGDLRPGNSPASVTFGGSVGFAPTAVTRIELGGTTLGNQYDHITVTGDLALGGTLAVSLLPGFTPAAGQSFDLLDWTTLTGTFSSLNLPALAAGLAWNTSQLYTTGVLSVATVDIPGDYNNNGVVDAADYVLWRKGGPLANEIDNPGTTNAADYTAWRARFGNTIGSGTGSGATGSASVPSVPEPASIVLLIVATACSQFTTVRFPR